MPTTPVFDMPYPSPGDPNNVPVDLAALALRIDAVLVEIEAAKLTSGVYTPVVQGTGLSNVAITVVYPLTWMRVGDIITVDGRIDVDPSATGPVSLEISLPVPTNLATSDQLSGTAVFDAASGTSALGWIEGRPTTDTPRIIFSAPTSTISPVRIHFAYQVI